MNNKRRDWLMAVITALMAALVGVVSLKFPNDPDMGWHLRNGEEILKNGFAAGDTFSWTMTGYPWVAHEWLSDILMYFIHHGLGLWGLVVFFAVVIFATFYLAAGIFRTNLFMRFLLALMGILVSWNVIGVRPQMFTLLGLVGILYILFDFRRNPKSKLIYLLPIIFALWANLHGGFPIGLIALALFGFSELWRNILLGGQKLKLSHPILDRKQSGQLLVIGIVSIMATFLNPSGWRVYLELIQTFADRSILNSISEWLGVSLFYRASYNLTLVALLTTALIVVNRFRQLDITKLILFVAILVFSTTSWRHLPLFAIVAMPLLAEQIELLVGKQIEPVVRSWMSPAILSLLVLSTGYHYLSTAMPAYGTMQAYAQTFNFPQSVIDYLKANPPGERILNEYNWGGYLVWQYPERKVFIDGRMAIWKWKGVEIFKEFQTLLGADREAAMTGLRRWEIDTVLTSATHPMNFFLQNEKDWEQAYADRKYVVWRKLDPGSDIVDVISQ